MGIQVGKPDGRLALEQRRAATGGQGIFSALSFRSFRMYWSGAFISSVGSWLQVTAVLWFVKSMGSDTLVGFVNMVAWLPILFLGLFAGAVADRLDRRKVVLMCQIVMMICSVLIGICIEVAFIPDLMLIVFLAISGIAYALFVMAWVSTIPILVPKQAILSAVTLNNVQFNLSRFLGPVIGGLLLLITSDSIPFYLNALTFGAFIILILLSHAEMPALEHGSANVVSSIFEGLRYVRENRWIGRLLLAISGLSFFGFSFMILIPSVCQQILHVSDHDYGFLMGMTGLGALLGMLAVASLKPRAGLKIMMVLGAVLNAGFLAAFSASHSYWLSCLLAAGCGGSFVLFNAAAGAALLGNVSIDMQGRISSMWTVAYLGTFPIGGLLLGVLSDVVSLQGSLLMAGLACVAVAGYIIFFVSIPGERGGRRQLVRA